MQRAITIPLDDRAARRVRLATRLAFLTAGIAMAGWAALVPFVRARLAIDDAAFGLLLLCLGVGSIAAMPAAGMLAARLGCRVVIAVAAMLLCTGLVLLAVVPTVAATAAVLLLFGASLGSLDVAMNVQAVRVERNAGLPLMSGFHALYSAGGIVGALSVAGLLQLGLGPVRAILAVVAGLLALLALAWRPVPCPERPEQMDRQDPAGAPFLVLPRGPVVVIGLLCAACFLAEGAVVDWSAVFLARSGRLDPTRAGLGYAAFSATMTIGRFGGDRLVARLGAQRMLAGGALAAAAGLAAAVLSPGWGGALAGFAVTGAGLANLVPLLINAAGRQPRMPEATAVAAVATLGYAGVLGGPALLGGIARLAGLPAAFGLVCLLLLAVSFQSRRFGGAKR